MEWEEWYPLTDLDMTVPKLDKLEAIEAKKPPPLLEAGVCLGSIGAMAMKPLGKFEQKLYKRKPNWEKEKLFIIFL